MSRGFDLIRRHLVGRRDDRDEPASSRQGPAAAMVAERSGQNEVAPDEDIVRRPGVAPPPFDPVRVATTPPPPKTSRAGPKPHRPVPRKPAYSPPTPSRMLRQTRLPEVLRPTEGDKAGKGTGVAADAEAPAPQMAAIGHSGANTEPLEAPGTETHGSGPQPASPRLPNQNQAPVTTGAHETLPPRPDASMERAENRLTGQNEPPGQTTATGSMRTRSAPARTRRIDKSNARAARRHSIFVALMKGLLPGLVLGLAAVFFFYSYDFQPVSLPDNIKFDPGKVSVSTDGIRMVAPKLTGVDDKQQTFEIKADEAIQDRANPSKVTLLGIDARINLTDGGTIGFSAQKGVYNTDLNQIWLSEELEVRSSEGYVAQLSEAQVDFKNGLMVSNSPVLIFTNDGVINASGIQVLDGGKKVIFSGRVTLNLNGSAGETQ